MFDRRVAITYLASVSLCRCSLATVNHDVPITSLVYSPDGSHLIAGSQSGVSIRNSDSLREVGHFSPDMDNIHDLRFNHQGNVLAVAGGNPGEQGVVELIGWPKRKLQKRIRWHDDVVDSVDFSSDDRLMVTASTDEVCSVFERSADDPVARFTKHSKPIRSVRFLPNGNLIVSASCDETLRVWEAHSGMPVRTLHNHSGDVHALALRPSDGDALPMIASASADLTIRFWQPTIGRMIRFARIPSEPLCIEWTNDGAQLIAGCRDGSLRFVDPVSVNAVLETSMGPAWLYAVAVDPLSDNRVACGASDGSVKRTDW